MKKIVTIGESCRARGQSKEAYFFVLPYFYLLNFVSCSLIYLLILMI